MVRESNIYLTTAAYQVKQIDGLVGPEDFSSGGLRCSAVSGEDQLFLHAEFELPQHGLEHVLGLSKERKGRPGLGVLMTVLPVKM